MYGLSVFKTLPTEHEEISRMLARMEQCSAKYIQTLDLKALEEAKRLGNYHGFLFPGKKGRESCIWPSIGYGRNVFLPVHTDNDYFLSAAVMYTNMKTSDEIMAYFCFPTEGISVALRNGNVLLFNPKIPHCLSSPCKPHLQAFSLSAYLKSLVVSGNSNNT
jgi:hypothetical protein